MKQLVLFVLLHLVLAELDLENLQVPELDIDDFAVIKDKCEKAGGSYADLKAAKVTFQGCVEGFVNVSAVQGEIDEAKKTGSMDEVFGKYCAKKAKLTGCVDSFTGKLRPCLNEEEGKALNTTLEILRQLGDFVCFRDGDRIAMFIAEGGVECIKEHVEGIKNCVNTTLKIEPTTVNTNTLPTFLMDKKKCNQLGELQTCVVEELEKCKDSTPANIVDALFKFIKKSACINKVKRSVHIENMLNIYTRHLNLDPKKYLIDLKEKCAENAPDGGYEAFTLNTESTIHCIKNVTTSAPLFSVHPADFKRNINGCSQKYVEKIAACLPEDEKYWPRFYLEIIENIVDFLYANDDQLNGLPKLEVYNCLQNFKEQSTKEDVRKCFQITEMSNLKKEVVCSKMRDLKTCLAGQIEKKCVKDVAINKLTKEFFQALLKACNQN